MMPSLLRWRRERKRKRLHAAMSRYWSIGVGHHQAPYDICRYKYCAMLGPFVRQLKGHFPPDTLLTLDADQHGTLILKFVTAMFDEGEIEIASLDELHDFRNNYDGGFHGMLKRLRERVAQARTLEGKLAA